MNKTIQATSSTSSFKNNDPYLGFQKKSFTSRQKIKKTSQKIETSLPFISPFSAGIKNMKVNEIRKQSEDTQEQIILMRARLHTLKQMKNKMEIKKQKSLQKIQFIDTVRERKKFESVQKLKQKQKQNKELDYLKQKAKELREGMRRQIIRARQTIYMNNIGRAYQKKEQQVEHLQQIEKKNKRQHEERIIRVQIRKQQDQKHAQILSLFQQSRIKESKNNHMNRIQRQLKQKEKRRNSLEKLKQQHQKYIEELKVAERQYGETIQKFNPEVQTLTKRSRVSLFDKMSF